MVRIHSWWLGCVLLAVSLAGCGDAEKDLDSAKRREKRLQAENAELRWESYSLQNGFKQAVAGDDTVWVVSNFDVSYTDAEATCSRMSYALPTEAEIARLQQRDPESSAGRLIKSLQSEGPGSLKVIHLLGKTQDVTKGVVICRKPVSKK